MREKREWLYYPAAAMWRQCTWRAAVAAAVGQSWYRAGRAGWHTGSTAAITNSPNLEDWTLQQSLPECITPQGASGSVGLPCQVWQVHVSHSKETFALSIQPSAQLSRRGSKRHRYEQHEPSNRLIGVITQPVVVIRFGQWRRWPLPDLVRLACWEALNTWVAKHMAPSCAFPCYWRVAQM